MKKKGKKRGDNEGKEETRKGEGKSRDVCGTGVLCGWVTVSNSTRSTEATCGCSGHLLTAALIGGDPRVGTSTASCLCEIQSTFFFPLKLNRKSH
jgi:hypothetical protein